MLGITNLVSAQNYKKSFKALGEKNYTSARIGFQQAQMSINTKALGDYGMAVVYRSTSLRIEDMYKACESINDAKKDWAEYDVKFKKKYSDYLTEDIIIEESITIDKKLFSMLKKSNNAKSIQTFLDKCPNSIFKHQAILLRDSLAYIRTNSYNTISAFRNFINNYPEAKQVDDAKVKLNALAWSNCISKNEIDAYKLFISDYNDAPQVDTAKILITELEYQRALSLNTDDAFSSFIAKYPNTSQADSLKKKGEENAYKNVLKFESIPICSAFISNYPSSEYLVKVVQIRDSIAFADAKRINTNKAYEDFIFNYPNSIKVPLALSLMSKSMYSRAEIKRMIAKNNIKTNRIKSLTVFRIEENDTSNKSMETRKEYDIFGNIIIETEEFSPENIKETKYIYDNAGDRLIKKICFINNKIQNLTEYEYDIRGLNTYYSYQCQFNCDTYGKVYYDSLKYDDKRNLISSIKYNSSSKIIEANYYKYDIKGNMIQDSLIKNTKDSIDYIVLNINYNGQGNIIQELKLDSKGTRLSVNSYSYDGLGKLITSTTYDASGTIYRTLFYNEKGIIKSEYLNYEEYKDNGFRRDYIYQYREQKEQQ